MSGVPPPNPRIKILWTLARFNMWVYVCYLNPLSLSLIFRFTKNLSPDKINLSTLKGEGQLSNLELDEEVLQNMLDLPTWLAVTRVYCNKAAIRVSRWPVEPDCGVAVTAEAAQAAQAAEAVPFY